MAKRTNDQPSTSLLPIFLKYMTERQAAKMLEEIMRTPEFMFNTQFSVVIGRLIHDLNERIQLIGERPKLKSPYAKHQL